jgi:hypothetical protein
MHGPLTHGHPFDETKQNGCEMGSNRMVLVAVFLRGKKLTCYLSTDKSFSGKVVFTS